LSLVFASGLGAQEFGRFKKTITLQRKLPAVVQLPGDRFAVTVTSSDAKNQPVTFKFKTIVETQIAKYDPKLMLDPKKPDTDISLTILNMDVPQPAPITASSANPFSGFGSKKKSNQPAKVIGYQYTGRVEIAYQAKTPSGGFVDADDIKTSYSEQSNTQGAKMNQGMDGVKSSIRNWGGFRHNSDDNNNSSSDASSQGPKTVEDVQQILMTKLTALIATRLVNTNETVEIDLARGGPLDDALKYADVKQWSKMAEALDTMTPLSHAHEDAYRLYDLGVAYEALAYSAETPTAAKRNLEEAAADYGKAADMNPEEKGFLEPQNRIEIALEHYKKLSTPEPGKTGGAAAK
jgi:hypothetical protein